MKRLDLILNGKGGVGKSFFAVNFVQFLKDKSIAHIAIDSDNENSTLKRFHPDVQFLDLANRRELDGIFRSLEGANLVVVDCRADSTEVHSQINTELGGREIVMHRLQDWLVEALSRENLTITAATKHPAFSLLDRQRIQIWQRRFYAEIESASDLLLPTK